jgi:exopolysaccharide biosynthesis polyprenyl glycosylphosphotransferase
VKPDTRGSILGPVATKPVSPARDPGAAEALDDRSDPSRAGDIRAHRPYLLSRSSLAALARRAASTCVLIAIDLAGLTAGLYAALAVRELWVGHSPPLWGTIWATEKTWLPFLALVTVLVFWRAGLYRRREVRAGFGRILSSLVLVALLALAFAIGTGFEFSTYGVVPATLLFAWLLVSLLRASYERVTAMLLRRAGVRRRVLLVAEGDEIARLGHALGSSRSGIDYELLGAIAPSGDRTPHTGLGDLGELQQLLDEHRIDEIVVSDARLSNRQLLDIVDIAHRASVSVRVAPTTAEILAERAEYVPGHGVPLFELRPPVLAGADWALKRLFDLVVSGLLVVVGLPIWIAIAIAIRLTSRGSVFYRDPRIGLNEREFPMLKFRTMEAGAAGRQPLLEDVNEAPGALFKIRDDPRVTAVGRLLRRFSIDEIPQVLNVLRGEMSLVGPRPLPRRDYALLEPWHRKRSLVLPGMTGLWQISGRSDLGFDDLVNLDFFYLETWSIWLDVSILLKTVPAVVRGRGAY